jgi:hypothetical protein
MMGRVTPEQLANLFEMTGSTNPRLKSNISLGGVDSFQTAFGEDGSFAFTDLGAGPTDLSGRMCADLTDYTQVKLAALITTAGVTSVLGLAYSLDDSVFAALTANPLSTAAGANTTDWETIPAAARTMVTFVIRGSGGDASEDPAGYLVAHFRR